MPMERGFTNRGFTLVELLVVIAISTVAGVVAFINIGSFRNDQDLQTGAQNLIGFIRTAQANASSNVKCGTEGGAAWFVEVVNSTTVDLKCQTSTQTLKINSLQQKPNIQISSISGSTSCFPTTIRFSSLSGNVNFETSAIGCFSSDMQSIPLTVQNTFQTGTNTKNVVIN